MRKRLLNIAAILSASLSLVAAIMGVRSGYATDSWELPPRFAPHFNVALQAGWVTHRHIESHAGCFVWISYDVNELKFIPQPFYQVVSSPLLPGQWGRYDVRMYGEYLAPYADHGRIPYVVEWYIVGRNARHISVPWPAPMVAFALLPLARWLWSRRRVRASKGPAFPVLPK